MRDNFSVHFRQALKLAEEGNEEEADEFLHARVEDAKARYGNESQAYADANFDYGLFCLITGNLEQGVDSLCETTVCKPRTKTAWRTHASGGFQLGCALNSLKRFSEAEMILRDCLKARAKAFGNNHLEWHSAALELSETLINLGKPEVAQPFLVDAVQAFLAGLDLLACDALVLKTIVDWQMGVTVTNELQSLNDFQDGDLTLFLQRAFLRLQPYPPDFQLIILERICDGALTFLPDIKLLFKLDLLRQIAWKCKECGQFDRAEEYMNRAIGMASHFEDTPEVVWSLLMLGEILKDAGHPDRAEQAILSALSEAQSDDNSSLSADAVRGYARLLCSTGRSAEAQPYFAQAIELCKQSLDAPAFLAAAAAYGVFLHHSGHYAESKEVFGSLSERLDEADAALLDNIARHLAARNADYCCGCFPDVDEDAITEWVSGRLDPEGRLLDIIDAFDLTTDYKVQVRLKRAIDDEEKSLMNSLFKELVMQLRHSRRELNAQRIRCGIS